jgi:hypothetical protein
MTPSPVAFCGAGQPWCLEARDARWWGRVHLSGRLAVALLGLLTMRLICLRLGELSSPREGSPWVILGSREVR